MATNPFNNPSAFSNNSNQVPDTNMQNISDPTIDKIFSILQNIDTKFNNLDTKVNTIDTKVNNLDTKAHNNDIQNFDHYNQRPLPMPPPHYWPKPVPGHPGHPPQHPPQYWPSQSLPQSFQPIAPVNNNLPPVVNEAVPQVGTVQPKIATKISDDIQGPKVVSKNRNVIPEEFKDIIALMSKYFKVNEQLTLPLIMLQYFFVTQCNIRIHPNWVEKKQFTRAELLMAAITDPSIFGELFTNAIQATWMTHFRENLNIYEKVLPILIISVQYMKSTPGYQNSITLLIAYLTSPKSIAFSKTFIQKKKADVSANSNNKETSSTMSKTPNVRYIILPVLDKILIQLLHTALRITTLQLDLFDDLDVFESLDYSVKCKYLIDFAKEKIEQRAKLAQEKQLAKVNKKANIPLKDENISLIKSE